MAEPQPAGIQEGDHVPSAAPASAEDRRAAAALSNLDTAADNDNTSKQADTEALGKAMKGLDVSGNAIAGAQASKKAVKVDPADVTLLVSSLRRRAGVKTRTKNYQVQQLDVSRPKATELLKANGADVAKAISFWIEAA